MELLNNDPKVVFTPPGFYLCVNPHHFCPSELRRRGFVLGAFLSSLILITIGAAGNFYYIY